MKPQKLKIISCLLVLLLTVQLTIAQTDNHIKVPGTKCSMIPPEGFLKVTSFSGFQHPETGSSIMITEMPSPYQTLVEGFTSEMLKTNGMTLVSKQQIDFNNTKATLIYVTQVARGINYIKQILVFGDLKGTVLVNGIYPESSKGVESKIKEALLSTVYNETLDDNPLDAATFTIDVKDTEFKLVKYMSGSLLYSADGKLPTEKSTLVVANSLGAVPISNQKEYAEERLKKLPGGEQSLIKESVPVKIDDLNGYEIIADGKTKDNKAELIYQVMLFNENGEYYIMVGVAKENFDKNLEAYRKISKTFKRK